MQLLSGSCAPAALPMLEPPATREQRRKLLRAGVGRQLAARPSTVAELVATCPAMPYQPPQACGPDCGGHVGPVVWQRPSTGEVRRLLSRFEAECLATRLIVPGWRSHMWSLAPRAIDLDAELLSDVDEL